MNRKLKKTILAKKEEIEEIHEICISYQNNRKTKIIELQKKSRKKLFSFIGNLKTNQRG